MSWWLLQKEGELLNAMWHTWIGRLQRTKIIEAQATIPPCQLQGNFANWRANICARTIPRAKNRHEFSKVSDDFRNGLLSQQRQRRSIFFHNLFDGHFVLLYGFVCWSGDSERSSLIREYCFIEFVAVSGQEIKLPPDDIDENATFFLYFCLDWNYWRLAYFTILGPYVGYACCSGGEIINLDDLITCSIMSTFVAAGERD
jgi:hypothetical protein